MMEQEINIERFTLTSSDKLYIDHRRCFNACVDKQFKTPQLQDNEKLCIKNCLFKFKDAEKFMIEKVHRKMEQLIRSDMGLMNAYNDENDKKAATQ